jgi:hypothetical protein
MSKKKEDLDQVMTGNSFALIDGKGDRKHISASHVIRVGDPPFETLAKALAALKPGEIALVPKGTYVKKKD